MALRFLRQQPGLIVSGVGHAAVLVAGLVAFSTATPFADQQEAIAVDVVSESDLRELTRGTPTEKKVAENPRPVVDKQSEKVEEQPKPGEAPRDVPAPPSRPQTAETEQPEAPKPPPPPPPPPPQQATPPKPQPAPTAETAEKQAEEKPEPARTEPAPQPPKRPEIAEKPPERQPEPKKPEPKPEPKREDLAKLIEDTKPQEKPAPAKSQEPDRKFSPNDIRKLLESKDKPQNAAATGQEVNRTASLGTRTGNAARLSPADADILGGIVREQLAQCWSPPPGANPAVKPIVRMSLNPDGSLKATPSLANASGEAAFRSVADSALRAVRRCAPFRIPERFQPFYADWQEWNVILDPSEFLG
ncbi:MULTISPECIES: cell envelope integrity protein TolA [unclassified Chelatococcus]|uniref:cell envelope integrity protein TolA n=1 Tax=unclassified Chelatococcus TaxID=2638111 RepID=UPI00031A3ECE|nr:MULTISPECIES: cell envelope integrity protein TolA [unclassified Chelatococcus]